MFALKKARDSRHELVTSAACTKTEAKLGCSQPPPTSHMTIEEVLDSFTPPLCNLINNERNQLCFHFPATCFMYSKIYMQDEARCDVFPISWPLRVHF